MAGNDFFGSFLMGRLVKNSARCESKSSNAIGAPSFSTYRSRIASIGSRFAAHKAGAKQICLWPYVTSLRLGMMHNSQKRAQKPAIGIVQ
jgi:hypothetical protein